MKRIAILTAILLLCAPAAPAQEVGQARTITIWDNATAPHSNHITLPEAEEAPNRPINITRAELFLFPADPAKATGQAVVICPGGGYRILAFDYEGYQMAKWFAANGITAAVLKYRLPNGHPEVPLEDAEQALRILRGEASGAEGFTCPHVGVVGSSAGGHLAAMVSTIGKVRPDFTILFYPVITTRRETCNMKTVNQLLGTKRTSRQEAAYALETRVTEQTPPAILFLSDNDTIVHPSNSTDYYNALKRHNIQASIHIYPSGEHGWGILDKFRYKDEWQHSLLDWLGQLDR